MFASARIDHGRILKCGGARGKAEKFANTPDHCFICNDDIKDKKTNADLDRIYYIQLAKKRLKDFGIEV